MKIEELKGCYAANEVVAAICDHMADRPKNQNETKLHRMMLHLEQGGDDFRKSDVIAAFRQLEDADCGRCVEGRHGWKSRFVWSVKSLLVAGAARGVEEAESLESDDEPNQDSVDTDVIEHMFWLRHDLQVSIELPVDLTESEANRLAQFVSALSFEE